MLVNLYRKKPVQIEAVEWDGSFKCAEGIAVWMGHSSDIALIHTPSTEPWKGTLTIATPEGDMLASVGDYIIKGVQGEFYPCKPHIFEQTYEPVGFTEVAVSLDDMQQEMIAKTIAMQEAKVAAGLDGLDGRA